MADSDLSRIALVCSLVGLALLFYHVYGTSLDAAVQTNPSRFASSEVNDLSSLPSEGGEGERGNSETHVVARERWAREKWGENVKARTATWQSRNVGAEGSVVAMHEYYLVPLYPCPREIRLGDWKDGGKWYCDLSSSLTQHPPAVFSVGCGLDTSFEAAVGHVLGSRPLTIDPTLQPSDEKLMEGVAALEFRPLGLAGGGAREDHGDGHVYIGVEELLMLRNATYADVFKIDCEGCEVAMFDYLAGRRGRGEPMFGQIMLEVHSLHQFQPSQRMLQNIENLGYQLFHAEANPYDPSCCHELAYIHESLILT